MTCTFPHESSEYRAARARLLAEELALRAQVEKVATLRRSLPQGGAVADGYVFEDLDGTPVPLQALFTGARKTLAVYSLMFRDSDTAPCPMCSSMLDGLAGQAQHVAQRLDLVVVAKAAPARLKALSEARGWTQLRLFSARSSTYQADYLAETPDGSQLPMMNIFRMSGGRITHFWGSEALFADVDGQPRHVDQLWPLWNMLDLTPEGRGDDWYPSLSYA